jgi:hypothetical protein
MGKQKHRDNLSTNPRPVATQGGERSGGPASQTNDAVAKGAERNPNVDVVTPQVTAAESIGWPGAPTSHTNASVIRGVEYYPDVVTHLRWTLGIMATALATIIAIFIAFVA